MSVKATAARLIELRLIEAIEPHDWQERHSPTEAVEVRIDHRRTKQVCTRRKPDARMFNAMTLAEQKAADRIRAAVLLRIGEVACKVQDPNRLHGRAAEEPECAKVDWERQLLRDYDRWIAAARAQGLSPSDVIQIIVHGQSCAQQDRERRQRNGTAKAHLIQALALFAVMKGWQHKDFRREGNYGSRSSA